jgi:hypothetical protein
MNLVGRRSSENLRAIAPYLGERREFRRDNVDELLGPYPVDWRDLLPRLLEFGTYNGFLHRSDRTVHEQVLFRLESKRRPVHMHDIVDGAVIARPAEEVRKEMLKATAALRSMGIARGDRVAIVGTNSTRYLVLDVAIGLAGAVSVPLYYTSPPRELDELIQASGAKLLLKEVPDPQRFGVPAFQGSQIVRIDEKPKQPASKFAVIGIYFYDATVFTRIGKLTPSARGEYEITDINNSYLSEGQLTYDVLTGWWTDAGTFESLWHASDLVREGTLPRKRAAEVGLR